MKALKLMFRPNLRIYLKIKILNWLYPQIQDGEISNGKAAEALGISKTELLDFYGELGLPYFNMSAEELEHDIQVLKNLTHSS